MKRFMAAVTLMTMLGFGFVPLPALADHNSSADGYGTSPSTDCGGDIKLGQPIDGHYCLRKGAPGGPIVAYARIVIRFISGILGLVVVGAIVWHLIRYIAAGGSPQTTADAKSKLANAVLGLVLFIFMYGILETLVPGRIF